MEVKRVDLFDFKVVFDDDTFKELKDIADRNDMEIEDVLHNAILLGLGGYDDFH